MDLRQFQCLVAVADQLSFARAAELLYMSPSNVSQHVSNLEGELGVRLFDRTSRRVELTEAGERVCEYARRILTDVSGIRLVVRQGCSSTVVVAFCPGAGELVGELTSAAAHKLPGIEVEFRLLRSADILAQLEGGHLDVGISRWTDAGLASVVLSSEPETALVMPHRHRLAGKDAVELADLDGEDIIIIDRATNARFHDQEKRLFFDRGIRPRFRTLSTPAAADAMELVAAGGGCVLTTFRVAEAFAPRGTAIRPIVDRVPAAQHFLVWRPESDSPQVASFIAMASSLTFEFLDQPKARKRSSQQGRGSRKKA
jgi:DNA-binding transcriptional LysR family regulator